MPWREPEIPDTTATKTTPPDRSLVAPLPVVLPLPPLAFAVSGVPASGSAPLLSHATVLGFLLGMVGAAVIALYVLVNHRSRARGGRAHWTAGWLLALPGMAVMGCGWGVLCLAEPRVQLPGGRAAGAILCSLAAGLYAASAAHVGRWRRPSNYSLDLRTTGVYAHVRHPQALALCLLALGLAAVTGSVPFLLTLPVWLGFWTGYTYLEEHWELLPTYGEDYRRYRGGGGRPPVDR